MTQSRICQNIRIQWKNGQNCKKTKTFSKFWKTC